MRYIAFLRGINVGGHVVKMERLRPMFAELGLSNVGSYIQSGNIFFDTDESDRAALTARIEAHLLASLGYAVPVMLRTIAELETILALEPFKHLDVTDDMRLCVMFLSNPAPADLELPLRSPKNDMDIVAVTEREAFVVWHIVNGRPPASSSETWLTKTLHTNTTTTRFFHTAAKILAAAKKDAGGGTTKAR